MEPISYDGFANLHPLAPAEDAEGYAELVGTLEGWLAEVTGYARVSVQPNAGSQGELAGLLAIRGLPRLPRRPRAPRLPHPVVGPRHERRLGGDGRHEGRRGQGDRRRVGRPRRPAGQDRARTPTSSPRSWSPTRRPTASSRRRSPTSAPWCTTPGGQVYVDGANLNALLGLAQPGRFGADVSHLNLHKTFCIPHGGGGPGRRTGRGRASTWCPFLPGDPRTGAGRQGEAASARSRPRRTGRPASCRSAGPTSR